MCCVQQIFFSKYAVLTINLFRAEHIQYSAAQCSMGVKQLKKAYLLHTVALHGSPIAKTAVSAYMKGCGE